VDTHRLEIVLADEGIRDIALGHQRKLDTRINLLVLVIL